MPVVNSLRLAFSSDAERHRYLHLVSLLLPKPNRDTMEVLFVFLKWVASFSHVDEETGSKMDLPNLATVIAPSILYAKGRDAAREESFMGIRVATLLLEYQDDFFTVPNEMLPMLHDQEYFASCLDMPSKDALKKCETYMRLKQGRGSAPNGGPPTNGASMPGESRPVHQRRSDPMIRDRPTPPFADGQTNGGGRSPRSQSRGPPPSSSHGHGSSHGHDSPSARDHNGWIPGSPPPNYRSPPPPAQHLTPNTRAARLPPLQDGEQLWSTSPWETPPRSRPSSPYGVPGSSVDHPRTS
jgi:hypothetical protein